MRPRFTGGLLAVLLLAAAPGAQGAPPPRSAWAPLALPASLDALLRTGRRDRTPRGFRVVALSVLADGCGAAGRRDPGLRPAAVACVERALALADAIQPRDGVETADQGLWLSHVALILGARDLLGGCADPARHRRLAAALAARSLREPTRHVPSFPAVALRWPADQTATLAALARHDRAHGGHLAEAPLREWRAFGGRIRPPQDAGRVRPPSDAGRVRPLEDAGQLDPPPAAPAPAQP